MWASLHGAPTDVALASSWGRAHESDRMLGRSDRGVRGSAGSGAYGRKRHTRTRIARRSGWVRRETPDPPVSLSREASHGKRARRKLRRDAGNARGAGARKRSSGKQKSVGTHRSSHSVALSQGRRTERELAHRRPSVSADADDGSPSPTRMGREGRACFTPRA